MPLVCLQLYLPFALPANHPLQVSIGHALLAADPAILQLSEVAFKKANLMLVRRARHIRAAPLDAEMVVHSTAVDSGFGLRNQLGAPHIRVPFGGAVDCDFGAMLGVCVAWVLVRGGEVDVGCYGSRAVDIVLVGTDLVCPGPFVEVGGGGEVVEAAVPEDGAWSKSVCWHIKGRLHLGRGTCGHGADERIEDCGFSEHVERDQLLSVQLGRK